MPCWRNRHSATLPWAQILNNSVHTLVTNAGKFSLGNETHCLLVSTVSELLSQRKPCFHLGKFYITTCLSSDESSVSSYVGFPFSSGKLLFIVIFIFPEQMVHHQQVTNNYLPNKYLDLNKINNKKYGTRVCMGNSVSK